MLKMKGCEVELLVFVLNIVFTFNTTPTVSRPLAGLGSRSKANGPLDLHFVHIPFIGEKINTGHEPPNNNLNVLVRIRTVTCSRNNAENERCSGRMERRVRAAAAAAAAAAKCR